MNILELTLEAWLFLMFGALMLGVSKTGIPAFTVIPIALFALALPSRESIAIVLFLFVLGDVVAIFFYRAHADWPTLRGLIPSVAVGVVVGAVVLFVVDDTQLRKILGAVILGLAIIATRKWWLRYLQRRKQATSEEYLGTEGALAPSSASLRRSSWVYGIMSGWATMVANSAGPIMSLYLVSRGLNIQALLGTSAWFYLAVNLTKVPFSIGLGLVTVDGLLLNLALAPIFLFGTYIGLLWAKRVTQKVFDGLVLILSAVAGLGLLLS
jgi:uncharacterized membrane protein YfcA